MRQRSCMQHIPSQHLHGFDPPDKEAVLTQLAPSPSTSPWANPDLEARVVDLWQTKSGTQICVTISEEFGVHLSRNAVVGRMHRLGLTSTITKERTKTVRKPRQALLKVVVSNPKPEPFVYTGPRNLPLSELEEGDCRFITNDNPEFLYCGNPKIEKSSFCQHCHGIVW